MTITHFLFKKEILEEDLFLVSFTVYSNELFIKQRYVSHNVTCALHCSILLFIT